MVVRFVFSSVECTEELPEDGFSLDKTDPDGVRARERLFGRCLGGACSSNFKSQKTSSTGDVDNLEFVSMLSLLCVTPVDTKSDELLWARVRMLPRARKGEL